MSEQIRPFRAWCQKVLPLVYDDSLSYYELLCKVTNKLNEIIGNENELNTGFEGLKADFEKLKEDLNNVIEDEASKVIDAYVTEHSLISTVNGIGADHGTGNVTLKASDVGAIANVNESVKTNNLDAGSVTGEKIAQGAVTEGKIASGAVTGGKIASGAVSEGKIANGAVTSEKLAANSVSQGNIQSGAVSGGKIASGAVSEAKIADGAVSSDKIASDAVVSDKIADGAIVNEKIADSGVTTNKIKDGAVTIDKVADRSISGSKIVQYTITNDLMSGDSVDNINIRDNAVTNNKIADATINPVKIAGGSENSGKLLKVGQDGIPFWGSGEGKVTAGVESVNGKDGAVTLTANDVGAIANTNNSVKSNNYADKSIGILSLKTHISQTEKWNKWLKTVYPNATPENTAKMRIPFLPYVIEFNGEEISVSEGYNAPVTVWEQNNFAGYGMHFVDWCELTENAAGKFYYVNNNNTVVLQSITPSFIGALSATNNSVKNSNLMNESVTSEKLWKPAPGSLRALVFDTDNTWKVMEFAYSINGKQGNVTLTADDIGAIPNQNSAISTNALADACITTDKIKDLAITTGKIVNLSVTGEKLASGSVTATKIGDNSVTTNKIASKAITEEKIGDGAVTSKKLADMCVGLAKMENLGSENAGKALVVQSNGNVGLGEAKGSTEKNITLTNSNNTVVITKTPIGTNIVFNNNTGVTLSSKYINFGTIPIDMLPDLYANNFSDTKSTAFPPRICTSVATDPPSISTSSNARFKITHDVNFTISVGAINNTPNIATMTMFIPGT